MKKNKNSMPQFLKRAVKKRGSSQAKPKEDDDLWAPPITTRESMYRSTVSHEETAPAKSVETLSVFLKNEVKFKTGSRYKGYWNALGMAGNGEYSIFHGVDYDGELDDGMFSGKGIMWYPNNARVEGVWYRGCNVQRKYYYNDGLRFEEQDWTYCKHPNRRFKKELTSGIRATGRTILSNKFPPRPIPPGCYDVGDGFYNPETKCVTHPDTGRILRIPPRSEEIWILENCRKSTGLNIYKPPKGFHDDGDPTSSTSLEVLKEVDYVTEADKDTEIQKGREYDYYPKMVNKASGRFDLLHKKVQNRGYSSKYIFIDELRSRACKKHRLYLPAIRIKTKITILPNLRVTPPLKCVHDTKAIVANKLTLLLRLLKECDKEGGIKTVLPFKLKRYKKELTDLIKAERKKTPEVSEHDLTASIRVSNELSSRLTSNSESELEKNENFFSIKDQGDLSRSVYSTYKYRALKVKNLAEKAEKITSLDLDSSQINHLGKLENEKLISTEEGTKIGNIECDVCQANEKYKLEEMNRKKKIDDIFLEAEEEEKLLEQEQYEIDFPEDIVESQTDQSVLKTEDDKNLSSKLNDQTYESLPETLLTLSPSLNGKDENCEIPKDKLDFKGDENLVKSKTTNYLSRNEDINKKESENFFDKEIQENHELIFDKENLKRDYEAEITTNIGDLTSEKPTILPELIGISDFSDATIEIESPSAKLEGDVTESSPTTTDCSDFESSGEEIN